VEALLAPRGNGSSLHAQNLVDQRVFTLLLNHEIHKATRLQYCFSILCLTPDLPPEHADPTLTTQMATVAISHLRATDLASTLPPSCVTLLLIDAEARNLPGILQRLKGALEPLPLILRGRDGRFTMSAGGGSYPQTATSGSELLRQAIDLMTQAKAGGGNQLYLPPGP